jgi:hypothetical protein
MDRGLRMMSREILPVVESGIFRISVESYARYSGGPACTNPPGKRS